MGIEIVLYDSSPVTQKIFFHVLYHYGPVVHRVDEASALIDKVKFHSPDIIFIDSAFSEDQKLQKHMVQSREKWANIPIILMTSKDTPQVENPLARDILKKPISAGRLRELINNFVPKTKHNILNRHLNFPPMPAFAGQQGISPVLDSRQGETAQAEKPLVSASLEGGKDGGPPAMDLSAPEEAPAAFSTEAKGEGRVVDTNTGIRPATDTSIQEEGTDFATPSGDPLMDGASLADTGTGIIPVGKVENSSVSQGSEGSEKGPDGQLIQSGSSLDKDQGLPAQQEPLRKALSPDTVAGGLAKGNEGHIDKGNPSATVETALMAPPLSSSALQEHIRKEVQAETERLVKKHLGETVQAETERLVKKHLGETVQAETEQFVEKQGPEIIQKAVEKVVWQVVPELSRQLITKELNRLMKEEEEEED